MLTKIRKSIALFGIGAMAVGTIALAAPADAEVSENDPQVQAPLRQNPNLDGPLVSQLPPGIPEIERVPPKIDLCKLRPYLCEEAPETPPAHPGDDNPEDPKDEYPEDPKDEYPEDEYPEHDGEWEDPGYDYPTHVTVATPSFTG